MGMSLPGGGRSKSQNFELNLVPFIDLLSVNITFLLVTAVMLQLRDVEVEQRVGEGSAEATVAPLTVQVTADAVAVYRNYEDRKVIPSVSPGVYDWVAVDELVREARADEPTSVSTTILTEDGVAYRHMVRALDITRAAGFSETALAGATPRTAGR